MPNFLHFRNGRLKGAVLDDVTNTPLGNDAAYWPFFKRFNANIVRRVIHPASTGLGTAYTLTTAEYAALDADIASAASLGAQTVIAVSPSRPSAPDERHDNAFWMSTSAKTALAVFWGTLATRFLGDERIAAFDIIHEPHDATAGTNQASSDNIIAMQVACIATIRAIDFVRACVIEPMCDASPLGFSYLKPVEDINVVYSVHFFEPKLITGSRITETAYTHLYPSAEGDVVGGLGPYQETPANRVRLFNELSSVINFSKQYHKTIFVGEFGCSRATLDQVASNFIEDCVSLFNDLGWSWTYRKFSLRDSSSPWQPFLLPDSSTQISTSSGLVTLNTITGASSPNANGRTPSAPLSDGWKQNILFRMAEPPLPLVYYAAENFDVATPSSRPWTSRNYSSGSGALNLTYLDPLTGAVCGKFSHGATVGTSRAEVALLDEPSRKGVLDFFVSFDVLVGSDIATGKSLTLITLLPESASLCKIEIKNLAGTDNWIVVITDASGTLSSHLVTGLHLKSQEWSNIQVRWYLDSVGRIRVWQGLTAETLRLLIDMQEQLVDSPRLSQVWCPHIGYKGDQVDQEVRVRQIVYGQYEPIGLIQPVAGSLTIVAGQPTVAQTWHVMLNPSPGYLTFTGQQPLLTMNRRILPGAGSMSISTSPPIVERSSGSVPGSATTFKYVSATSDLLYRTQYAVRNPGVVGANGGGNFVNQSETAPLGWTISSSGSTGTASIDYSSDPTTREPIFSTLDMLTKAVGKYAIEIVVVDLKASSMEQIEIISNCMTHTEIESYYFSDFYLGGAYENSSNFPANSGKFFSENGENQNSGVLVEPVLSNSGDIVAGDVIGFVYDMKNRNVTEGCVVDVYKNGVFQIHATSLPYGTPSKWIRGVIYIAWRQPPPRRYE